MTNYYILLISFLAIAGVILKPFKISEYIWACAGAAILFITGFLSSSSVLSALAKGNDVYLFLVGMMLLAEAARVEGLFNWLAAHATRSAKGSAKKLFF